MGDHQTRLVGGEGVLREDRYPTECSESGCGCCLANHNDGLFAPGSSGDVMAASPTSSGSIWRSDTGVLRRCVFGVQTVQGDG